MQKVDDRIRCALRRSAERCGSILALSRLLEVSHSTILFWLNGRIRNISADLWLQKVFPVLEDDLCLLAGKEMTPFEVRSFYQASGTCSYGKGAVQIPLMYEQDLLSYLIQLESIASFAKRNTGKMIAPDMSFPAAQGYYAVLLDHLLERYDLPWSTLVIFSENISLADQELVLLRIRDEDFLRICRFHSSDGKLFFEDVISREDVICWYETGREEDLSQLLWVFPVAALRFCCRK